MRALAGTVIVASVVAGCSDHSRDPMIDRGRSVYLSHCTACHAMDPAVDGPVGPAVKGTLPALLEARVLHAAYPPGYRPKRSTHVMPALPQLAPDLPALARYLAP